MCLFVDILLIIFHIEHLTKINIMISYFLIHISVSYQNEIMNTLASVSQQEDTELESPPMIYDTDEKWMDRCNDAIRSEEWGFSMRGGSRGNYTRWVDYDYGDLSEEEESEEDENEEEENEEEESEEEDDMVKTAGMSRMV